MINKIQTKILEDLSLNNSFKFINMAKKYKTEDFLLECIEAKAAYGFAILNFIEKEYQTEKICLAAIKNMASNISYIKIDFTDTMKYYIAKNHNLYFSQIPKPDYETCLIASLSKNQGIDNLKYIPNELLTEELIKNFVNQNKKNVFHIPPKFFNESHRITIDSIFEKEALRLNDFSYIENLTDKHFKKLLEWNGNLIYELLDIIEEDDLIEFLIYKNNVSYLRNIDTKYHTKKLSKKILEKNLNNISYIRNEEVLTTFKNCISCI